MKLKIGTRSTPPATLSNGRRAGKGEKANIYTHIHILPRETQEGMWAEAATGHNDKTLGKEGEGGAVLTERGRAVFVGYLKVKHEKRLFIVTNNI